jgi:hypothetical protein
MLKNLGSIFACACGVALLIGSVRAGTQTDTTNRTNSGVSSVLETFSITIPNAGTANSSVYVAPGGMGSASAVIRDPSGVAWLAVSGYPGSGAAYASATLPAGSYTIDHALGGVPNTITATIQTTVSW